MHKRTQTHTRSGVYTEQDDTENEFYKQLTKMEAIKLFLFFTKCLQHSKQLQG